MDTFCFLHGLRFIDSFFPSGGYAFSAGLEAAVQGGQVASTSDLSRYAEDLLRNGLAGREAVAVGLAHRAVLRKTLGAALATDRELEVMKLGRASRLASRQMGRQIIRIAGEQADSHSLLRSFLLEVDEGRSPGHFPVALGLTLGAAGWSREQAIAAFLYQSAIGLVSAALKLLPVGQRDGQRLLESWLPLIGRLSQHAATRTVLRSWVPVHDIYGMRHHRLTMRLFRS
jgi:urease accessory protein